ncbi:TfoX/Sxy family protein [Porphyromonas levii]|uniref:Competence protein TfoX n=1 Tax=Porphyromonas levii TaxID=28114 RepID=A0A4Y8WPZ9_9PORP|nr:TfoX/Sxy family protein [Porphyromonas levii]TFH94419.1 competence protein TfoX [Porphyromonas levii]TFH95336.1 competence protein TfoX [Porphyromonas levii]
MLNDKGGQYPFGAARLYHYFCRMNVSKEYARYVADQCSGAGEIRLRKMFGAYCLYCNDKVVAFLVHDEFLLKPTEAVRPLLKEVEEKELFPGSKGFFCITDIDNHRYMSDIVRATYEALPMPKPKRPKKPIKGDGLEKIINER